MMQEQIESYAGQFEPSLIKEIGRVGVEKNVSEGEVLMDIGQYIKSMPLLISGVIKILREDENGDELLLYFLEPGDTCAMTMTCCMGQTRSEIRAVAETDARLIMIPAQKMEEWTSRYKSWRDFVFEAYHDRLNEMLATIDSIAFKKMDERLLQYLKDKAKVTKDCTIYQTHSQIASDLHTSRVVVSRLLKKLEHIGKIELHRNHLRIKEI